MGARERRQTVRDARTSTTFIAAAVNLRQAQQPLALELLTERREKLREGDLQRASKAAQCCDADISFAPLDAAHVVSMEFSTGSEFLLRDSKFAPQVVHASPDKDPKVVRHSRIVNGLNTIGLHTIVFTVSHLLRQQSGDRVECPLCGARGTLRGRPFRLTDESQQVCPLCEGAGSVPSSTIAGLQRLRNQMQRVADLMQAGNADGAATAFRIAVRLARPLLPHPKRHI